MSFKSSGGCFDEGSPVRDTDHAFTRSVERFDSAGVSCVADVYRPREARAQHVPVIVMAQGFGGVRRLCLPSYAERFAAAGYVVALFDYRFFGDSEGSPRELLDIAAQLEDWRAAVSWARTLDGVDPERVVGWGTSFAGGHVLTLAGTGTDFTAVIAQVPHVSGFAAARATGLRQSLRLAPAAIEDLWRSIRGREPRYVASIGPAGSAAVMATADADPAVDRMVAASGMSRDDFPERVAARVLLSVTMYSPLRYARNTQCPALIQVATEDEIAPAGPARTAADRIPRGTIIEYDAGHFDLYIEPLFEQVVADQLEFLASNAPVQR